MCVCVCVCVCGWVGVELGKQDSVHKGLLPVSATGLTSPARQGEGLALRPTGSHAGPGMSPQCPLVATGLGPDPLLSLTEQVGT